MLNSQANNQKTNTHKQTTKHKRRNNVASIEINTKHENKPINQQTNKQTTNNYLSLIVLPVMHLQHNTMLFIRVIDV